jgi:uncharacterized membrane protein
MAPDITALTPMTATTALTDLLHRQPLVFFHLLTAVGALATGAVVMLRRTGTGSHRAWGWAFVVLMASTAVASGFIRDDLVPNLAGFTPIHVFTVFVLINLPRGIWYIRQGNVVAHRKTMRGLFIGGCMVAGVFTLLPGRFLGRLLWQSLGLL